MTELQKKIYSKEFAKIVVNETYFFYKTFYSKPLTKHNLSSKICFYIAKHPAELKAKQLFLNLHFKSNMLNKNELWHILRTNYVEDNIQFFPKKIKVEASNAVELYAGSKFVTQQGHINAFNYSLNNSIPSEHQKQTQQQLPDFSIKSNFKSKLIAFDLKLGTPKNEKANYIYTVTINQETNEQICSFSNFFDLEKYYIKKVNHISHFCKGLKTRESAYIYSLIENASSEPDIFYKIQHLNDISVYLSIKYAYHSEVIYFDFIPKPILENYNYNLTNYKPWIGPLLRHRYHIEDHPVANIIKNNKPLFEDIFNNNKQLQIVNVNDPYSPPYIDQLIS